MAPERVMCAVGVVTGAALSLLAARAVAGELVGFDAASATREQAAGHLFRRSVHLTRAAAILARDGGEPDGAPVDADAELGAVLVEALSRAPSSPYNWARLSALRWQEYRLAASADALMQSVATGPHAPRLAAPRAAMGFALMQAGEQRVAALTATEVREAAREDAAALARHARDLSFADYCRTALADDPEGLQAFTRAQQRLAAGRP